MLILFLIMMSGGLVTFGAFPNWPYVLTAISCPIFFIKGFRIKKSELVLVAVLVFLTLLQTLKFSGPVTSIVKPIFTFAALMFTARIVRQDFRRLFVGIMVAIAFISLCLWALDLSFTGHGILLSIANSIPQFGADVIRDVEHSSASVSDLRTLYFYSVQNFQTDEIGLSIPRNAGPFFEPGRFTIFLTLALALDVNLTSGRLLSPSSIILLIADITTFSTSGYLALAIILIGYIISLQVGKSFKVVSVLSVLVICALATRLPFISEKIVTEFGRMDIANSRFGAMLFHLPQIMQSPFIGYGAFLSSVFPDLNLSPCGWTDMIRYWGIPLTIALWVLLYRSMSTFMPKPSKTVKTIFAFLAVMTMCFSQTIMTSPFFYILYFFGLYNVRIVTASK